MRSPPASTRGEAHQQLPHRSFWREGLARRAGSQALDDWLVEQANLRGFWGAWLAEPAGCPLDPELSLEEILVGLCQPHAPADARTLKLVVRILQSGRVDPGRLHLLARRERATFCLSWLLQLVPEGERNEALEAVATLLEPTPRGARPVRWRYDPARLVRRKAWTPRAAGDG